MIQWQPYKMPDHFGLKGGRLTIKWPFWQCEISIKHGKGAQYK